MNDPTFDRYGYPTDETLEAIEHWPHTDWAGLMEFVVEAWHECGWIECRSDSPYFTDDYHADEQIWCAATGGWSGNESITCAMERNQLFTSLCWYASIRGGYHEWRVPVGDAS